MSEPDNAFPHPSGAQGTEGLTKREWFAGMALQAVVATELATMDEESLQHPTNIADSVARSAFALADAMLAASKEPGK